MYYRATVTEDFDNIIPNEHFIGITIEHAKQIMDMPTIQKWSVFSDRLFAIIIANEFCKDMYAIGLIVCKGVQISELKYLRQVTRELVEFRQAKYVYSEGETNKVRDRFHEFMGFEIELDLDTFKKWKLKGLEY